VRSEQQRGVRCGLLARLELVALLQLLVVVAQHALGHARQVGGHDNVRRQGALALLVQQRLLLLLPARIQQLDPHVLGQVVDGDLVAAHQTLLEHGSARGLSAAGLRSRTRADLELLIVVSQHGATNQLRHLLLLVGAGGCRWG